MPAQAKGSKTSFILHLDLLQIVKDMDDQEAGQFIKIILHYQETGEILPHDKSMKFALAPFFAQFKRDDDKRAAFSEMQSEKGKQGGRGNKKPEEDDKAEKAVANQSLPEQAEKAYNKKGNKKENVNKNEKDFIPPTLQEAIDFFKEKGFSEAHATKAWNHYALANWRNSEGKPVLYWKQTFNTNWMNEKDKIQNKPPPYNQNQSVVDPRWATAK